MNHKMRKSIIIFGVNGQVGHSLVLALHSYTNIIPISRKNVDISDIDKLSILLNNFDIIPDLIINASAYTAVDKAEKEIDLCNIINNKSVEIMALYCKNKNIPFIHYSTDYVFDGDNSNYTEIDIPNPLNIYGKTKLLGEQAIQEINPTHFIFRTSWVYDFGRTNFLSAMLKLSQSKDEIKVVNDQFGTPTWSMTIANITAYIINSYIFTKKHDQIKDYSGIYNLVSEGDTNWCDYAKKIFEYANINIKVVGIPSLEYPMPAKRPKYSILNVEKIKKTFNIDIPMWEDALKCCLYAYN